MNCAYKCQNLLKICTFVIEAVYEQCLLNGTIQLAWDSNSEENVVISKLKEFIITKDKIIEYRNKIIQDYFAF